MSRIRMIFAAAVILASAGIAQAAPTSSPQAAVLDRLAPAFATHDPARLASAFRAMGEYGLPAAEIVEASINAMGYRHLENGQVDEAIAVFDLNTETFPRSANAWDSLADAMMSKGERQKAILYYHRAHELDAVEKTAELGRERLTTGHQCSPQMGS